MVGPPASRISGNGRSEPPVGKERSGALEEPVEICSEDWLIEYAAGPFAQLGTSDA
jgi:hypothetical protein